MNLFPNVEEAYTKEHLSARYAQRLAEYIAFGPIVFQASRMMLEFGILDMLRDPTILLTPITTLGASSLARSAPFQNGRCLSFRSVHACHQEEPPNP